MAGIVVVFDFDKTILDVDSDNWVVDQLGATHIFEQLLPTMQWNSLMDRMMIELASMGKTIVDIANVLKQVPIHPRIITAIKSAHAAGCDLRIVSDANVFFIETILEHVGLRYCFSEINTNPSFIDEQGRLRISPYHNFHNHPHGCNLCPPNMCKGLIIERVQESLSSTEDRKKLIYIGDGAGDYCPILKLKDHDYAMPRKNYPVWGLICKNPALVKATIHEWTDGEEFADILLQRIANNSHNLKELNHYNHNPTLLQLDCKFQTTPVPTAIHESLSQAVQVLHFS